ncbi:MAG: fructosamine kinase family protein [Kangiellaceae bacterium]|nr:fructosamine kinase family protein [Kangiellaceae bacterium]MCW8997272.1 fructosamine kinase family protein [Kangiellaceae bacterium]
MQQEKQVCYSISQAVGKELSCVRSTSTIGGDINQAFLIDVTDGSQTYSYFVKQNSDSLLEMFEREAEALEEIITSQTIKAPQSICFGCSANISFLVLEKLELGHSGRIEEFARKLAALHLNQKERFGFNQDNFIGSTPQPNSWGADWIEFFGDHRLLFQLDLLRIKGGPPVLYRKGLELIKNLDIFFAGYHPKASLLHGDLWSGNYSFVQEGEPVIYDPASYYGDHEADLAMLELFGRPGPAFFSEYNQVFPIHEGYKLRKTLYNLYHILNHANLFGGGYARQAESMIDSLLVNV